MTEPSVHLTTSRVNRLLRPLRNKCNALAEVPKAAPASRVTYSKRSPNWDPDSCPPLAVLYPSTGTKKLTLGSRSAREFDLLRRIRAVCDAFKNIAHVAYDRPCIERIPSLAAMCSLVVGENMPAANSDSTFVDSSEDSTDENDSLDVDGIYEAVPPHYRRFLIGSHALSMILRICAHHHTLVTLLLDHCLSFGLVHESTRLLNIIFAQAFMASNSSYPPPVTHPAHTNYLLDLHTKWTTGSRPSGASSDLLLFTTSAFCQAALGALSKTSSCNLHILWASKVLNKLLHAVESCDIDSYIVIIRTLSRSSWDAIRDDAQLATLRDKLSELMSNLFDLLFTHHDAHSSPLIPSRIHATIDILHDCYTARLHRLRLSTPRSPIDLPDIIIIFATCIFVAFRDSVDISNRLLAILDDSTPVPTTFSKLMVYFSQPQESRAFGDFVEVFLSELRRYSSAFCSEKLFGLDASLWACALHHFETSITNSQKGSSTLLTRYKRQVMDAVDAAERRCFGGAMDSSPAVSLSICSKRTQRKRLSGHWEWEDMVGSWIRKTPVHKKRKIDEGGPPTPSQHYYSRPRGTLTPRAVSTLISVSTPLSTRLRPSSTFSPSSSLSSHTCPSELGSRTEDGSEYQEESDKENCPSNRSPVVKRSHLIKRQSLNFFSLLADAQTNRIVLHSNRRLEQKPPCPVTPEKYAPPLSSQGSHHLQRKQERKEIYRKVSPPVPSGTILPSDDSLDLFACATSSPARC